MKYLRPAFAASLLLAALGCSDTGTGALGTGTGPVAGNGSGGASPGGASTGGSSAGSGIVSPQAGSAGSLSAGGAAGAAGAGAGTGGSSGGVAGGSGGAAAGSGGLGIAGEGIVLTGDRGTDLYNINCGLCHGVQGVGGLLAPETQHPVRDYSTWVVRTGLPGKGFVKPMEAIAADKLSDADLKLIFDYLDKPPQPTTGQALYHDYCANCHGADGKGGPTTRNIIGTITHPFEGIVRDGTHPGMYDERNEYMSPFSTTRISDAELALIKTYVDTL